MPRLDHPLPESFSEALPLCSLRQLDMLFKASMQVIEAWQAVYNMPSCHGLDEELIDRELQRVHFFSELVGHEAARRTPTTADELQIRAEIAIRFAFYVGEFETGDERLTKLIELTDLRPTPVTADFADRDAVS